MSKKTQTLKEIQVELSGKLKAVETLLVDINKGKPSSSAEYLQAVENRDKLKRALDVAGKQITIDMVREKMLATTALQIKQESERQDALKKAPITREDGKKRELEAERVQKDQRDSREKQKVEAARESFKILGEPLRNHLAKTQNAK